MKKYLLLFFSALLLYSYSFPQNPFARPGAKWCIGNLYPQSMQYGEAIIPIDTIVNGIPCSLLPEGCLYVDHDTVYRILSNGETKFTFNYNALPGDTWAYYVDEPSFNFPDTLIPLIIDSVSKIVIRNDTLRVLFNHVPEAFCNYCSFGPVVEHIGAIPHYLYPGPWGLVDSGQPWFLCYSDSIIGAIREGQSALLTTSDSCECHRWMDIISPSYNNIHIAFNYAAKSLKITDVPAGNSQVIVYNMAGQLVLSFSINQNTEVPLKTLAPGYYLVKASADNHIPTLLKIGIF